MFSNKSLITIEYRCVKVEKKWYQVNLNDTEFECTHGYVNVEDDIKVNTNETECTHGDVNVADDMYESFFKTKMIWFFFLLGTLTFY